MDADFKRKWTAALRSTEFKQARETLCGAGGSLCCIGVGFVVSDSNRCVEVMFTEDAAAEIGLTPTQMDTLVDLNDMSKKSFPEIADWIEANL